MQHAMWIIISINFDVCWQREADWIKWRNMNRTCYNLFVNTKMCTKATWDAISPANYLTLFGHAHECTRRHLWTSYFFSSSSSQFYLIQMQKMIYIFRIMRPNSYYSFHNFGSDRNNNRRIENVLRLKQYKMAMIPYTSQSDPETMRLNISTKITTFHC